MVSLAFARNYAYVYWGSFGVFLAFVIPMDPTIVGPKSVLGPLVEVFPEESLGETQVWVGHCWGVAMLSLIAANYYTPGTDELFVSTHAILAAGFLPACALAWSRNYGFFWTYFFPIIPCVNMLIYASATDIIGGTSATSKKD